MSSQASTAPSVASPASEPQSVARVIDAPERDASAYEERAPAGETIAEQLAAPFELHFQDTRGGVNITYITGEQCASRLNHVLGLGGWKWTIPTDGYDENADEYWVLGRMEACIEGTWTVREQYGSSKVKRSQPPCDWVYENGPRAGQVCEQRKGDHARDKAIKDHPYRPGGRGQPLDIGFDKKAASTDALKKCATLYGVGLYLLRKQGGVANEGAQAQRRGNTERAERRSSSSEARRPAAQPAAPAAIRCQQSICTEQDDLAEGRCGDIHLAHDDQQRHAYSEGACGLAIEPTEIEGRQLQAFQFVNEFTMRRFKKPLCRRHFDGLVAAEERQQPG